MEKSIWEEISGVSYRLKHVYQELIDLSEEIEYRYPEESCAGDNLKMLASALMDEIQRLYPMDY